MHREVTFAGFGGQGILLAAKLLAQAGMDEGREVVWLPSYGPEMRGGTAYCNVVISDKPIGSPVFSSPSAAVVMNRPSLDKFGPIVKKDGLLIINSSLIDITSDRDDIEIVLVPCNEIAMELGTGKAANMVALGSYVGHTGAVEKETALRMIEQNFTKKPKVIDVNLHAFEHGYKRAEEAAKRSR